MKSLKCHSLKGHEKLDHQHQHGRLFKGMPFSDCKSDFFDAK
jgi:hypothetical protein